MPPRTPGSRAAAGDPIPRRSGRRRSRRARGRRGGPDPAQSRGRARPDSPGSGPKRTRRRPCDPSLPLQRARAFRVHCARRRRDERSRDPARMLDRKIALRLGCVLAVGLAILHRGYFVSSDEVGLYFQTRAISEELSLVVPARLHMAVPGADGRSYSHYTIGQSLLAVPFHAAGRLVEPLLSDGARRSLVGSMSGRSRDGVPPVGFGAFPILFYPPLATAVLAGLFFLVERRLGASPRTALAASLALALTTHAGTLSALFLQHTSEAIGALGAFYFWHRFRA